MKEFCRYSDGTCVLTDEGGELLWSSDGDDEFLEEFDSYIDPEEIDDVLDYLEDAGYIDDEAIDVVEDAGDWEDDEPEGDAPWLH